MKPIILHGHQRPLTQIKYNREGDLLFTAARDKSPNVFYANNGELLGSFDGHSGAIMALSVSQDSNNLATASSDQTVKLWSTSTGQCIQTYDHVTSTRSVELDGYSDQLCLSLTMQRVNNPSMLTIYDQRSQKMLKQIQISGSQATCARWGFLNKVIFLGHEDGTLSSWDPLAGVMVSRVKLHTMQITDLQLYKDRTFMITSSKDESAKIVDCRTLKVHKTLTSDRPLNSATLSPIFEQVLLGGGQEARDVTTTSARAGRFEVCIHHRVYGEEIGRVKGHFGPVNTLAFAPDGRAFSSGGEDGYVRIHHFDPDYFEYDYEME